MSNTTDKPVFLLVVNTVLGIMGTLLIVLVMTGMKHVDYRLDNQKEDIRTHINKSTERQEKLFDLVMNNQKLIGELLVEARWQSAQLNDLKDRNK